MTPQNMRRYHYSVYFPKNTATMLLNFFNQLTDVNVTYHAAHQMFDDPRGIIPLPDKNDLLQSNNILVEFYENLNDEDQPIEQIQKILIRVKHFSDKIDYTYLLAREGYIVSAWISDKNDVHRLTHSMHKYWCPENLKSAVYSKIKTIQKSFSSKLQMAHADVTTA